MLAKLIEIHYEKRLPLFVIGGTGIGKSQVVREVAKKIANKMGLKYSEDWSNINNPEYFMLIDIRASDKDRTDIAGYPVPNLESKVMEFIGYEGFPKTGYGIMFFDELNLAPSDVQKALYGIMLDRCLNGKKIPDGYSVIGAGNSYEDRADIIGMPAPLEQRLSIRTLEPPAIDDWIDWATANNVDNRIITFLKRFPDKLYNFNPDLMMTGQPVPRQWEKLSILIDGIDDLDLVKELAIGRIGEPTAIQFIKFLELSKDIDIEGIWEGRISLPQKIDLAYSVMPALLNIFKKDPKKNFDKAMAIGKAYETTHSPEFCVLWLKMIKSALPEKESQKLFLSSPEALKQLGRYSKYFIGE